jgi:RNA polymerase sigma-70 factor (ECF subfamily)
MSAPRVDPAIAARLFDRAGAARWALTVERFAAALETSVAHAFAGRDADPDRVSRYLDGLHVEDLALAAACVDGVDPAWEHFVREYRPALMRAADAIDPAGGVREIADALFADLYGVRTRDGERQPLLRYFHGRSSLATWLRAVLAQRHVDRARERRRTEPLPDESTLPPAADGRAGAPAPTRDMEMMRRALAAAMSVLSPRDRLRLAWYYVDDLSLARIGTLTREHEATVSRHLARTRRELRDAVSRHLREHDGLDEAAIADCFRSVASDAGPIDLRQMLDVAAGPAADPPARKNPGRDRSR